MIQVNIGNIAAQLYDEPNECPLCHQSIAPMQLNWVTAIKEFDEIEYVFRCPSGKCERLFIGRYKRRANMVSSEQKFSALVGKQASSYAAAGVDIASGSPLLIMAATAGRGGQDVRPIYDQIEFVPRTALATVLSKEVNDISPDFGQIYNQAVEAEELGLELICGPGYRKALEFLIKDYLCFLRPDDAEAIKKLFLGKCISEYVKDAQVSEVAKRAVWLANDETHYLRKWEDKDITDLKILVKLSVHWIEMDILTQNALRDMPEPVR
jgi:hypothetical protein